MGQLSTKYQKGISGQVKAGHPYALEEVFPLVRQCAKRKFNESVDVCVLLNLNPTKQDQNIRSYSVLPHSVGRTLKLAVLAEGEEAELATRCGADLVGFDEIVELVSKGELAFDCLLATPASMKRLGASGKIGLFGKTLSPRGLMPHPKEGTVCSDLEQAIAHVRGGRVRYRIDKGGNIHCPIGRADFDDTRLIENLQALVADLLKIKPASAKGVYIRKVIVSSTMGPGVAVALSSF